MHYVTYLRVSTDRQGKSGLGLDAQRKAVADHVAGKGEIAAEYVEIESGKKNDRPQLARALAEAKRIGAVLLIAKLDRLARNVAFIANLLEAGVEIAAADMPEANRFLLHVMAAVAEHEAQAISERTGYEVKPSVGYPTPGCLGTYCGLERDMPTLTYEIERGLATQTILKTHVRAIEEGLKVTETRRYKSL